MKFPWSKLGLRTLASCYKFTENQISEQTFVMYWANMTRDICRNCSDTGFINLDGSDAASDLFLLDSGCLDDNR